MRPLRSPASCLAIALVLAALAAGPALAGWPHSPTVNLPIPSPGPAGKPQAAEDGNGGAFVVWEDSTSAGGAQGVDLRAHHVLRGGTMDPLWPSTGIAISTATGHQSNARVEADGAGGFYVAWQDARSGSADIYALRVDATGSRVGGWGSNGNLVGGVNAKTDSLLCIDVAPDGSLYAGWHAILSASDFDPYAQHMSGAGAVVSGWPAAGLDFYPGSSVAGNLTLAAVATGGADVAYEDNGSGNANIIGGRISANCVTQWSATFCNDAAQQWTPRIVEDGQGGCIVTWHDMRTDAVYASRFTSSGALAPGWTPNGTRITPPGGVFSGGSPLEMLPDGEGGAFVGYSLTNGMANRFLRMVARVTAGGAAPWNAVASADSYSPILSQRLVPDGMGGVVAVASYSSDLASHGFDVTAMAIAADGTHPAPDWPAADPDTVCSAGSWQTEATAVTDGEGGFIAFWTDNRSGVDRRVYAQRVARWGRLGSPEPTITGVKDVRNDQGGQVRLSWTGSHLDVPGGGEVTGYRIWREVPAYLAQSLLAGGAATLETGAGATTVTRDGRRVLRASVSGTTTTYWEPMGFINAAGLSGYSSVVATEGDSTGASNPLTTFAVSSYTAANLHWMSAPATGYSVDDLAPAAPAPFAGTYTASSGTFLSWGPNAESDLAGYRLYRGADPGFIPGPGNLVAALAGTGYQDASTGAVYKLSAVDVHGNEGPYATALPGGTVDVPRARPAALALRPVAPNPARGVATIGFALPAGGRVALGVFDAQGRLVRTLADGERAAGEWTLPWDGRDETGAQVRPGLYLVRMRAAGRELTRRVVRVE